MIHPNENLKIALFHGRICNSLCKFYYWKPASKVLEINHNAWGENGQVPSWDRYQSNEK